MARFKILRGKQAKIPQTLTDGYAYFCTDTGAFFFDYLNDKKEIERQQVLVETVEKLKYITEEEEVEIEVKELIDEIKSIENAMGKMAQKCLMDTSFVYEGEKYYLTEVKGIDTKNSEEGEPAYCIFFNKNEEEGIPQYKYGLYEGNQGEALIITNNGEQLRFLVSDAVEKLVGYMGSLTTYPVDEVITNFNGINYKCAPQAVFLPTCEELRYLLENNINIVLKNNFAYCRNLIYSESEEALYQQLYDYNGNIDTIKLEVVEGSFENKDFVLKVPLNKEGIAPEFPASFLYVGYLSKRFFTENHLEVNQMGPKFKKLLTNMLTKEELSNIYSDNELSNIYLNNNEGVGQKTSDGGEIFNDYENNKAISPNTHAEGQDNIAGGRGFKFDEQNPGSKEEGKQGEYCFVTTLDKAWQFQNKFNEVSKANKKMYYSVVMNWNFNYDGEVLGSSIVGGSTIRLYIQVSNWRQPNETGLPAGETGKHDISDTSHIYFPDYPELGDYIIGEAAHADGINNKAVGKGSTTSGKDNVSGGKYSITSGYANRAGYAADAGGQETQAIADLTMTRGYKTKATGNKATALGEVTIAPGENALAHGQMPTEVPEGQTPKKGAAGKNSRTGGYNNEATGLNTEATGDGNSAQADNSFVINYANTAVFDKEKNINAKNSFVGGEGNFAKRKNQTILGEFAVENNPDSLFVIGNGSNWNRGLRSNALDVRKNGQIIAKAKPNSNESLTNKKYVDDSIQNEILDKFDRQDASFIFNNKRYYLTDIYRDGGYCIFSDETEMTNVRFYISQKIDNTPDILIEMNYQYKNLFSDFNENYFTYSNYMIGTNNRNTTSTDDDDYKYWSVSPYSIPTVDEVKSFFKYNNIELSKLEKIWIRSLFYYNNNPYIRFSKPQGNWGNIHLVVEGEYDTTGSVYSTTRTEDTYHCPVYMFMTYINRSFFLENHLNVYFMGTKFKELLSNMFAREELSNIYSENELNMIFNSSIIVDNELSHTSKNPVQNKVIAEALASYNSNINTYILNKTANLYNLVKEPIDVENRIYEIDSISPLWHQPEGANEQLPYILYFKDTKAREMIDDIGTVLDNIITIQNELIGGDA